MTRRLSKSHSVIVHVIPSGTKGISITLTYTPTHKREFVHTPLGHLK